MPNRSRGVFAPPRWLIVVAVGVTTILALASAPPLMLAVAIVVVAALAWQSETPSGVAAYLMLLGVQLPQDLVALRIALADFFLIPIMWRSRLGLTQGARVRSTLTGPFVALSVAMALALAIGVWRAGHVTFYVAFNKGAGLVFLIAGAYTLMAFFRGEAELARGIDVFLMGAAVGNVIALIGTALSWVGVPNPMYYQSTSRLYGLLLNPSSQGSFITMALLVELARLADGPRSVLRWANLGLMIVGVGMTLSRSSWLGASAGAATLIVVWLTLGNWRRVCASAWVVAGAVFVVPLAALLWIAIAHALPVGALSAQSQAQRLADLRQQLIIECARSWDAQICQSLPLDVVERERERQAALKATSPETAVPTAAATHGDTSGALTISRGLEDRAAILRLAWHQYRASWMTMVFGIGVGTFLLTSAATLSTPLIIHDTPMWFLVELGPLGLSALIWLLMCTFRNLWATRREATLGPMSHGLLAALMAWLVFSLFNEASYVRPFWLTLVAADRLYWISRND